MEWVSLPHPPITQISTGLQKFHCAFLGASHLIQTENYRAYSITYVEHFLMKKEWGKSGLAVGFIS